jgi:DNA-binding protein
VSRPSNIIFIGKKPILTYLNATLTLLANEPTVTIKARGRSIVTAVDVSQMIVKRMSAMGYRVSGVRIFSERLESKDGKERNVSTIEVDVSKN